MDTLILTGIAVAGLIFFVILWIVLSAVFRPKLDIEGRVRRRTYHDEEEEKTEKQGWEGILTRIKGAMEDLFKPLGEIIPRPPAEMSKQERLLVQAGFRRKDAVVLFYGAQLGLVVILGGLGLATGFIYRQPLLMGPIALLAGWMLPTFTLSKLIDARKERLRLGIPDALDLAVVCVEAGLGLDQALMRIAEELHDSYPDLSDELRLRNAEINLGRSRVEAFRNLAGRTGVNDIKSLVAILIQTDRFGTSVGKALRVFADSMRIKRQQRARERAAKLPLKMTVIMMLFVFPTVFIVVLGPGIIQVMEKLLPAFAGQ